MSMATTSNAAMRKKTPFYVSIFLCHDTSIGKPFQVFSPQTPHRMATYGFWNNSNLQCSVIPAAAGIQPSSPTDQYGGRD